MVDWISSSVRIESTPLLVQYTHDLVHRISQQSEIEAQQGNLSAVERRVELRSDEPQKATATGMRRLVPQLWTSDPGKVQRRPVNVL